ncbi:MAG: tRNA (adenosine(37)-N6)-threonylcarbamoyltransferase complex ATPase subunit type 1 TsaE [Lachnospiraceae bacterium]|nr:tRNA (adenosine(37)-N6)-threonylcarbamoyltransferase complex ATPase subunit type 1 TsaE [Lachnospiraceae bacterium]MBP5184437.1 tRNA (adenosine(37)-N6)-threonylcarbamoyltransferase complex ATPase subunit type 1 TsaE [Lachnospiraceae bacterium]
MDKKRVFESFSAEDTYRLGEETAKEAAPGQVYCLDGDLGVGKTVFTKGFAKGLGIEEHVNSPTFTILQVYEGRLPLYHFDVYRIEDEEELYEIGAEDYFYGKGVCLVEWAGNVPGMIPKDAVHVKIEKDLEKGFDYRRITIYETAGC